jgi:hypothetical protein
LFQLADGVRFRLFAQCFGRLPLSFSLVLFLAVLGISGKAFGLLLIEDTVDYKNDELASGGVAIAFSLPL